MIRIWRFLQFGMVYALLSFGTLAHALDVANTDFDAMDITTLTHHAASGNTHAQFFLAKRLQNGEGVAVHSANAVYWYNRAAEQGVAPAQLNLGIMYLRGDGVPVDMKKSRTWLEKATQLGDNRASYALAVLDEHAKRYVDAYKWYDLSAREIMLDEAIRNHARGKVGELALNLSSSELELAKQQANDWFANR